MITTRDGFANFNKKLIQSDITTTNTSGSITHYNLKKKTLNLLADDSSDGQHPINQSRLTSTSFALYDETGSAIVNLTRDKLEFSSYSNEYYNQTSLQRNQLKLSQKLNSDETFPGATLHYSRESGNLQVDLDYDVWGNSVSNANILHTENTKTINGQSIYGAGNILTKMVHHQITISTLMAQFTGNYIIMFDIYDPYDVKSTKYTSLDDFLSIHPGYSAICIGGHLKDNEDTLIDKPCNLVVFSSSTTSGDTSIKMYKDYIYAGVVYTITKGSSNYNYMSFEDTII